MRGKLAVVKCIDCLCLGVNLEILSQSVLGYHEPPKSARGWSGLVRAGQGCLLDVILVVQL